MKNRKQIWPVATLLLFVTFSLSQAQSPSGTQVAPPQPASLVEATQQYKTSATALLSIQEDEITKATAKLDELRGLVSEGLVARVELEASEQSLATLRERVEATRKQIADSDQLISNIQIQQEMAKTQAALPLKNSVKLVSKSYTGVGSNTILRSSGTAPWSIGSLSEIQSFFSSTLGQTLPTSAIGQSPTHNRLGYDHRNAVDVALHPDSVAGRSLITYLQTRGIPFLAFRGAIPGVATGPHIHIGSPSHRL